MKTKCLLFATLLTVSVVASGYGDHGPEMTIVPVKGSEVFKVIYKGSTSRKVKLNILNSQGSIIHSTFVAGKDGFICPLNFKGAPSGTYTIELIDDHGSHQQKVEYLTVHERKSLHVSKLMKEDGKFLFTVANAQNELIMIRIYDRHQNLLYSDDKTLKGDFAQVFRMPNSVKHCTFEIRDAGGNKKLFVY